MPRPKGSKNKRIKENKKDYMIAVKLTKSEYDQVNIYSNKSEYIRLLIQEKMR